MIVCRVCVHEGGVPYYWKFAKHHVKHKIDLQEDPILKARIVETHSDSTSLWRKKRLRFVCYWKSVRHHVANLFPVAAVFVGSLSNNTPMNTSTTTTKTCLTSRCGTFPLSFAYHINVFIFEKRSTQHEEQRGTKENAKKKKEDTRKQNK